MKTAVLFSGQGSQYIGMGKELFDNFSSFRHTLEEASEGCGVDLAKLIFEGTTEELNLTENTQPSVAAMSLAAYEVLKQEGISANVVAGLSLGEYSALTASGVFDIIQVAGLVKKRGRFMQEAVPAGIGKMMAVLNLSEELVLKACKEAAPFGLVEAANFNCPGQIVIGGEIKAVEEAARIAGSLGAKRVMDLPLSAPFHTSMLQPAALRLREELEREMLRAMKIPVISNVTADYIKNTEEVKSLLERQVMSSVLWEQSIRRMLADGVTTFVEVGPGKTLSGFLKRIDKDVLSCHVEDLQSLQATLECIQK